MRLVQGLILASDLGDRGVVFVSRLLRSATLCFLLFVWEGADNEPHFRRLPKSGRHRIF